ncbi:IS110 family transposase [Amycolatopsis acidiphila]|uniref:IS110 family transposase n=1 Tax=Amycolatopsis acidiphila TaxID=715473 RepID=UPI0019A858C7|nr:IS110 family transposase [Amycolatopsis acidiphila]UIJ59787.1 IS110 family transposase [Amycolatopsis acidiphila]UIJ59806.1 IS110 family transposase [Amycolatopsis acidiphila]GHG98739.1 IS110 family transposase [Amycolatopsis acidiphila]
MPSIPHPSRPRIVVGVDTHKQTHVAVALNQVGAVIGETTIPAHRAGYAQLQRWACELGEHEGEVEFGVEGCGSYGAGLASFLRRAGHRVVEVNRPDRSVRHRRGKDDTIDAETAARAVLSGAATAVPKTGDGTVEMIRQVKIAKDTATKARSQAIITLKTIIVNAPAELREILEPLGDKALIEECRKLRYESMSGPIDAACYTLRALADRYHALDQETRLHDRVLATLTNRAAPALTSLFGIAEDSASELLIVVGDNPDRINSEAALAKLCGACPIPASSGKTSRHRLNRGGHRQANAALHRILVVRMRFHEPTITYVTRRTAEGKTKKEIMRCLKRFLIREIYQIIVAPHKTNPLPSTT